MDGIYDDQIRWRDNLLRAWLDGIADSLSCRTEPSPRGVRLTLNADARRRLAFDRRQVTIGYEPGGGGRAAIDRIRFVERLVANRRLQGATSPFRLSFGDAGDDPDRVVSVMRLAFGLVPDRVPYVRFRFTAYQVEPWRIAWVKEGGDALFAFRHRACSAWAQGRDWTYEERAADLTREAARHCIDLQGELQERLRATDRQLRIETSDLKRLYFGREARNVRQHGVPLHGLVGDAAVEAEYRQRARSIQRRSHISIRLEVISLGEICCNPDSKRPRGDSRQSSSSSRSPKPPASSWSLPFVAVPDSLRRAHRPRRS